MSDLIERLRGPSPSIPAMRDAADEIERLRQWEIVGREWLDKTDWMQSKDAPVRWLGKHRADALRDEIERLTAELETERMRLTACGVVALANTEQSAAKAREMLPEYRSASLADVERAVDREMQLRAERAELRRQLDEARAEREAMANVLPGHYYMDPPDGGDVPLGEQVRRMALDARRYRWLRENLGKWRIETYQTPEQSMIELHVIGDSCFYSGEAFDRIIDGLTRPAEE